MPTDADASPAGPSTSISTQARVVGLVGIVVTAAGLGIQLTRLFQTTPAMEPRVLVDYLSYFTTLSNIAVVVVLTRALWRGAHGRTAWACSRLQGAVLLYIVVTGAVYALALSGGSPGGWDALANLVVHYVSPPVYVLFWVLAGHSGSLGRRDVLTWLALPVGYIAWTLTRGRIANWYPYPFIDPVAIGYRAVLVNNIVLAALFALLGAGIVHVDRLLAARTDSTGGRVGP